MTVLNAVGAAAAALVMAGTPIHGITRIEPPVREQAALSSLGQTLIASIRSAPVTLPEQVLWRLEALIVERETEYVAERIAELRRMWREHYETGEARRDSADSRIWSIAVNVSELERVDRSDPALEREVMRGIGLVCEMSAANIREVDSFIGRLAAVLSLSDDPQVRLIRSEFAYHSVRRRHSIRGPVAYGGTEVDLIEVLDRLHPEWRDDECLRASTTAYLDESIPLLEQGVLPRMRWSVLTRMRGASAQERRQIVSMASDPYLGLATQRKEIHDRSIVAICDCLDTDSALRFVAAIDALAYPRSFPDRHEATALAEALSRPIADGSEGGAEAGSVARVVADHKARVALVDHALRELEMEGQAFLYRLTGVDPDQLESRREALLAKREAHNQKFLDELTEVLGQEMMDVLRRESARR